MPAIDYQEIYAEARDAIHGDAGATTPSDTQLERTARATVREFLGRYSACLGDGAGGYNAGLTADEQADFYRAVGYTTAAKWLGTPAGKTYGASMTEVRLGPVTEKYGGRTIDQIISDANNEAASALSRISCIGDPWAGMGGAARSGRQVGCGEPQTVIDQMYGPCGEDDED